MIMKEPVFNDFVRERNLAPGSINVYRNALTHYTQFNGMTLTELLKEAEKEEDQKIPWRKRTLLNRLVDFRNYIIDQGYSSTKMVDRVTTFYKHHYIEIHTLPKTNYKNISEIRIPSKEDLQKALEISDPFLAAFIPFLVSTGLSKIDALNLTVKDFIQATNPYHNGGEIQEILEELSCQEDVIPTFSLTRQKTKKFHYTFASPEATTALVNYLQSRKDKLKPDSKLFKMSYHWLTVKFEELNNKLALGVTDGNEYSVFRCHTLRKYHATTLRDDGLSIDIVNSLQGKAKNTVDAAYFIDTPEQLKKRYVEHVNSLLINSEAKVVNVKTEEYIELEKENEALKEQNKRIDKLEQLVLGSISDDKLAELNKLL